LAGRQPHASEVVPASTPDEKEVLLPSRLPCESKYVHTGLNLGSFAAEQCSCKSKRLFIESQWVSKPLAFAGKLRPRRLNH
jgi:hypothetical protein